MGCILHGLRVWHTRGVEHGLFGRQHHLLVCLEGVRRQSWAFGTNFGSREVMLPRDGVRPSVQWSVRGETGPLDVVVFSGHIPAVFACVWVRVAWGTTHGVEFCQRGSLALDSIVNDKTNPVDAVLQTYVDRKHFSGCFSVGRRRAQQLGGTEHG